MNIESMMKEYGTYLYNFALKLTCNPVDAEDLVQTTFISAWKKQEQLHEETAVKKWLRTICYNNFLMDLRKNETKLSLVEDSTLLETEGNMMASIMTVPEEEVLVKEAVSELQNGCFLAMVRRLTLQQRIAFSLVDMFGMKQEEAADMLQVSENALKGLLYRARMNLDSFFATHCNLINEKNPCCCEAWIDFRVSHETHKSDMRKLLQKIDYKEKGYHFDESVRKKVSYLYSHMPDRKPNDNWYQSVIQAIKA